jgi:hypothetical protein
MTDDDDRIIVNDRFRNRATVTHHLNARKERVEHRHHGQKNQSREIPKVLDVPAILPHQPIPLRESYPAQRMILHAREISRTPRNVLLLLLLLFFFFFAHRHRE